MKPLKYRKINMNWRILLVIMILWGTLSLCGCDRHELEGNAFPLALGIEVQEEEMYHLYAAYPDLVNKDARENALAKDSFWEESFARLLQGTRQMSESSNRNVDLNHMKVLILDKNVLQAEEGRKQVVDFLWEKKNASWNTYVLLCEEELSDIFSEDLKTGTCLGIYLEDLLEGWENLKAGTLVTVGDLVGQYVNGNEVLLIPVVTVRKDVPVVKEFAVVEGMEWRYKMDLEQVFKKYDQLKILEME